LKQAASSANKEKRNKEKIEKRVRSEGGIGYGLSGSGGGAA